MSAFPQDLGAVGGRPTVRWPGLPRDRSRVYGTQVVAGTAFGLLYIVAVGLRLDDLATSLAAIVALIAIVQPAIGLAMLALILPMPEPELFDPIYVDALIVSATALGCLFRLPGDARPIRIHPGVILAIGYAVYTILSLIPVISGYPPEWAPTAALLSLRVLTALGIFIVASYLFRWMSPMPILGVGLLGAYLMAGLTLLTEWQIGPTGLLDGLLTPENGDRLIGGFSNANYFGFFLTQAALLTLGTWSVADARYRPFLLVGLVCLVAALVLTFSRGAYLGVTAGVIVLALLRSPRSAGLLAILAVLAAAILYSTFLDARFGGGSPSPSEFVAGAQSENWRRLAGAAGVSLFLIAPVFGVGFGVFQQLSPAFIGASPATFSHNAYIQIVAEQGLVGTMMAAGIVGMLALALIRTSNPFRSAALAMLAAYLVHSLFINSMSSVQISGLTWLTMAAALAAYSNGPADQSREG